MQRTILAFWNQPFALSETFVYNQVARLSRYEVAILGAKLPPPPRIEPTNQPMYLINRLDAAGWWRELVFKGLGRVPNDLWQWLQRIQPSLIHAHFAPYGAIALPLARQTRLPLLVSVHGTDVSMNDAAIWRSSYMAHRFYLLRRRALAHQVSRVITQSDFLSQIVTARHGVPAEKVVCIRYGIDLSRFRPALQCSEWGHILYVGRLIERKGLPFLIEALARLRGRFPDLRLTVIGDGPMRADYEAQAHHLLGDRVTFLGAQSSAVVHSYLERAYAFCMPSITMPTGEAESLGVVFLESMAMQVPPVSFRSGGIPEVIVHGQTGFLAEERNVAELSYYLGLLLDQRNLRNSLGEQGRRWVEQEFDLVKQNQKLEDLYDEIIAERSSRYQQW